MGQATSDVPAVAGGGVPTARRGAGARDLYVTISRYCVVFHGALVHAVPASRYEWFRNF